MAIVDAIILSSTVGSSVLAATISFNLLGAWAISADSALLLLLIFRKEVFMRATFGIGLAIGALPMLHSVIPFPYVYAVLMALLAFFVFVKPIKAPPAILCGTSNMAMAVIMVLSFFLPHNLPKHPISSTPEISSQLEAAPDVVLISIDTLRADAVYDRQDIGLQLPTLNDLRNKSLSADYALSSSNQTLPGHLGMLSGLAATKHGVRSNRDSPDPAIPLAAEYFANAGYQTSAVISNALLSSATGMHRGFSEFSDDAIGLARLSMLSDDYLSRHSWLSILFQASTSNRLFRSLYYRHKYTAESTAEHCTEIALEQLDAAYAKQQPLFQFIHLMDPHTNYAPPANVRGTVSGLLAPQVNDKYLPSLTAEISVSMVRDVQEKMKQGKADSVLAAAYYHQVYLEEVIEVDNQLRRIIDKLDGSGRPYVLLLTADHGEQFAEHGLMDHANSLYEENIRVPFILRGPAIAAGRIEGIPQLCDVLPTLLHYAGIEYDSMQFDGQVVAPLIAPRSHVAVDQKEIAIRDIDGQKWIGAWQENNELPVGVKLYEIDQGESENLLSSSNLSESLRDLIDYYYESDTYWSRQANAKTSAAQQAALNSLGYAGQEDDR